MAIKKTDFYLTKLSCNATFVNTCRRSLKKKNSSNALPNIIVTYSRVNVVGIATRRELWGSGFEPWRLQEIFSSPDPSRPAVVPSQSLAHWVPGLFTKGKQIQTCRHSCFKTVNLFTAQILYLWVSNNVWDVWKVRSLLLEMLILQILLPVNAAT